MIRPAKTTDVFALADIIEAGCARSRYAGVVQVDKKIARQMLAQAVQRHGGSTEGATFVMVNECDDRVDAFIFASLNRIYGVGDLFGSCDHYLLGLEDCDSRALSRLFHAYVQWAESIPRIYEIGASWADTIPETHVITRMFERNGFTLCGKQYRRAVRPISKSAGA